jgi:hypothetical protein
MACSYLLKDLTGALPLLLFPEDELLLLDEGLESNERVGAW